MQTLYLLMVDDEVQSLDLQSTEPKNASPMDSFFKNAHKNTQRLQNLHKVARGSRTLNMRVKVEHWEALMELEPLNRVHNPLS